MKNKIKEKKNTFTPLTVILLVVLILYCITFFYLLLWGVCTSFKVSLSFYRWEPKNFFSSYSGYEDWIEAKIISLEALAIDLQAEVDRFYALGRDYKSQYDAAKGALNNCMAEIDTLDVMLDEIRAQREEMHGFLPFYTYKHILADFAYNTQRRGNIGMWQMYGNSILYAGGCAFGATFVPCIAAYACARFQYKFSRIMHTTVIIVMMIPIVGSLPSEIKMAQYTHIYDKAWGLWVMRSNFLGLYFLVFYDICKALPTSFSEAAKMDGANNFQIFFKIALPLIKNTFFTVLLIKFIEFWNEYQAPMVFTPNYPTIAMGLNQIMSYNGDSLKFDHTTVPARMAAAVLTAAPVCVLFACFQKRLLGNLTMGGVKG
ncbi:MAG: carbohydrate ABC transporter permease [Clostridia bacterium]|nr:carbohydrate ABC transporter permease [Clostridia bacterium]